MPIRALIFDFDGLIIDTETPSFLSWQETFAEHHLPFPTDLWYSCLGLAQGSIDLYAYLQQQSPRPLDLDVIRAKRRSRQSSLIDAQPLLPGIESYLADARRLGLRVAIASSSPRSWIEAHLARHNLLSHFGLIRCLDDVTAAKPDPAVYLAVLEALSLSPAEAVAMEDSPNGIRAARAANLFCLAVPNPITSHLDLSHAHRLTPSLASLPLPTLLQDLDDFATR